MNNKVLQVIFILFILFGFYTVQAAVSNEQAGKILDRFKARQQELLFETNVGDFGAEDFKIFDVSKRMNIYGNIGEKIKYQRGGIEDKQIFELGKIMSLEESVTSLEEDIKKSTQAVDKINGEVIEIKNSIEINKKTLNLIRSKITEKRKTLLKYLEYIYKKSNNVYENDKFDNLKSILLNNGDISEIINDIYYKGIIQVTGRELIASHKKLVSELYMKKLEMEKSEKKLKRLRKIAVIDSKVLNDKKAFKERLLKVSKGKQALYDTFIKNKLDIEKKVKLQAFKEKIRFDKIQKSLLKKYDCEFVDFSRVEPGSVNLTEKCSELNKVLYAEQRLQKSKSFTASFFDWPISPKLGISSFYKGENYRALFNSDHEAIDIVATQGTLVKAPADGYVFYLKEPKVGEYAFFAIKHANGYVTVYGHVSEITVGLFDYVRKGQIIAKTGGTYGSRGTGLMSTGPHLHFETFQNEESIDPLSVLDVSYTNYSNILEKYKVKFESDYRLRKGFEYARKDTSGRVFKLDGVTEIERQKSLITKYTAPSFRNWEMWVDESLNGNIDPTFTMCVGLAESGLGRNTKTLYNVGNIGNTDSGAVRSFRSPREGVYAMIRTFNNKYLGGYTEIQQLSRYGNKEGLIYASSPDNWHNNIIRCMSSIKGYQVPDDYNFRLMQ